MYILSIRYWSQNIQYILWFDSFCLWIQQYCMYTVHRLCPLLLITQLRKFIFRLFLQLFAKLCYPIILCEFVLFMREKKFRPIFSVFMKNVYSKFWFYLRRCSSHSRIVFFPRLCRRDSGQILNPETPADKGWGGSLYRISRSSNAIFGCMEQDLCGGGGATMYIP